MKLKIQTLIVGCIVAFYGQNCMADSILWIDFGADARIDGTPSPGPVQPGYIEGSAPYVGNPGLNHNEPSAIPMPNYTFNVRGRDAVIVEYAGQAQNAQHMSINGFQLERIGPATDVPAVAESSSLLLLGFALFLLVTLFVYNDSNRLR